LEQIFGLQDLPKKPRTGQKRSGNKIILDGQQFDSNAEAAKFYGLSQKTVNARIKRLGWSIRQAFELDSPPLNNQKKKIAPLTIEGRSFPNLSEAARFYELDPSTVYQRRQKLGWSVEEALEIVEKIKPLPKGKEV
jgi:uncharacterized protein YjcR